MTLETVLGYWTALAFVAPPMPLPTLLGTALGLHICDAIMCRLVAHNNGYPKNLWTLLGFIGGIWAVAVLILLPRRDGSAPTSSSMR
ncbi:MAG TPA: hypothetical protein VGR62_06595 [Candidatus Binatia bacterium]|jgi:hypothetical protein|nr:hypothetical protein [Candidatus Binatia bacterium]